MRVIVTAHQKGGVGKTTLSGHLAVAAEHAGEGPAVLVDCDPQGSLSAWWNTREPQTPGLMRSTVADLPADLEKLREAGAALVIVDTPPQVGPVIRALVRLADLIVIPTKASPHDLRAVGATVEMAEDARKRFVFVLNEAVARARSTGQAVAELAQHGAVSPVVVMRRQAYVDAMTIGLTAQEITPKGEAAAEIAQLWKYVSTQLGKAVRA